jgi:hypothetical protein
MNIGITDEELVAFLHGELDDDAAAAVEAALNADPRLAERAELLAVQDDQIRDAFAPILDDEVPDRLSAIVASAPQGAEVVDLAEVRSRRRRKVWGFQQVAAMAASLVLGLFIGHSLLGGSASSPEGELLVAANEGLRFNRDVERVLSGTPSGKPVRVASLGEVDIALTFEANDGRLCRQFTLRGPSRSDDALACREGQDWQIEALGRRTESEGQMRTAAGDTAPAVISAVDALIAGEPLVGEDEKKALRY